MCILRTTTYWGCESTVCVDQLNPAGFNVSNVPDKENPRFFPARETKTKHKYGGGKFVAEDIHFQLSQ